MRITHSRTPKPARMFAVLALAFACLLAASCTTAPPAPPTDEKIKSDVVAALDAHNVQGVSVDVKAGVVTLTGSPSDPAAFLGAVEGLKSIAGVVQVVNTASGGGAAPPVLPPTPEIAVPPAPDIKSDDDVAAARIESRIRADAQFAGGKVTATVSGGTATLAGTVPSDAAKAAAEKAAKGVKGVTAVVNNLEVVQVAVADVPDETLESQASRLLEKNFPDATLDVSVTKGKVVVRGTVAELGQVAQIGTTLAAIPGVKNVDTSLLVVEGGAGERIGSEAPGGN